VNPAVKRTTALLAVALLLAGCGGQASHPTASSAARVDSSAGNLPTTLPVASPAPLTGAFGVLATSTSADPYIVSIIAPDGKVVASAQASSPARIKCGDVAAHAVVPAPISTSDARVYYMDAQGVVRFLTVEGETGRATIVPTGSARRSMFAVSPDDQRIAVVVSDYTSNGVSLKLYVEDLNGGTNHVDIYSSSGAYGLWPIGWHGTNNLVLAKVYSCRYDSTPDCDIMKNGYRCMSEEFHVVDAATAVRRFTVGGPDCIIDGGPTPAGVACIDPSSAQVYLVDWTGVKLRLLPSPSPRSAYLSPDGHLVALVGCCPSGTTFDGTSRTLDLPTCGWIDSTHVIAGDLPLPTDDPLHPANPARVGDVSSGVIVQVAAKGTCAGRLPGGL